MIIVSHNQDTLKVCSEIFDLNELKKKKILNKTLKSYLKC